MNLKQYQTDTLSVLRRFLEEARIVGPAAAYETITSEPEQTARLGHYKQDYTPLDDLPGVPYVCLRLPTGGGKTILGTHAIAVVRDAWIEKDCPLVLWLVPSNIIRKQTVEAFGKTHHPYRQALDEAFSGLVRVFDIGDFTQIRPQDIRDRCCVVVGTIQTLRVSDTEGRKVYAHNEEMEPHFSALRVTAPGLERMENGKVKFSFANLLHIHRPLMIVDEAHNAVTGLTREMQARVNPCAIVELTATPRDRQGRLLNNILHSVTAQELKAAGMIKLPILLSEHESWQTAVNGAVAARAWLAKKAERDPEYLRPIALFQAQPKNQEVTVEVLKKHLMESEQIPEENIAIATGDQRQLDGIDLFDRGCPIEHVITIEALKEGWDCSFAYVLCSVSHVRSAVSVEQLLGRVLRMPCARRRGVEELNKAYAFMSESEFGQTAKALVDKLVSMGFEEEEARDSVEQVQLNLDGQGDMFRGEEETQPVFSYTIAADGDVVSELHKVACDGVTIRDTEDGLVEVSVTGPVNDERVQTVCAMLPERDRRRFIREVEQYRVESRSRLSPAGRGEPFRVPRLMAETQYGMEFADSETFAESHDWSLLDHSPNMDEREFAIRETANQFEIDVEGRSVRFSAAGETQLAFDVHVEGWTPEALVLWLDPRVRGMDLLQSELLKWLRDLVDHLLKARGMHIDTLMRCKYLLVRVIRDKLEAIRSTERNKAYQRCLFEPGARVEVSFDRVVTFRDGMYQGLRPYRGHWKPGKHFLGGSYVPAFDGAEDGEECQCAQALDSLPGLKFWIRNVAGHDESFWLPTATGKFYPDFVAMLEDGRCVVVEYKGAHLADGADTNEKRTIGELWERKSGGRGLFVIVEQTRDGMDMRQQLMEKIGVA